MSFPLNRRRFLLGGTALGATTSHAEAQWALEQSEVTLAETATIDGRFWDTPFQGGTTVDAVHRSVLLRFPSAAEEIANLLRRGKVLAKAELAFSYSGYEIVPEGYVCRDGLGRKVWTDDPPTWHLHAWALRQPWKSDGKTGPTFNASVNGLRNWSRYGATDTGRDRIDGLFEPQELSIGAREARFDFTRLLSTPLIDRDAGARLRWLEQCGFLLRKVETYDSRYRAPGDAYEWAMPTGGHGLRFTAPRLILHMRRLANGGTVSVALPPTMRHDWEMGKPDGSAPTAIMPTLGQIADRVRKALTVEGPRTEWELRRIAELRHVGGDNVSAWANVGGEKDYKEYLRRIADTLAMPPRYWMGWEVADIVLTWFVFRDILAPPVQDHLKNYWRGWLQPELQTNAFVHPQSPDAIDYWKRNRDWRGRASFFRAGYCYAVSTQNFNHTAAMGALLGGAMIGSENAMGDGRHGLEALLLRFWSFFDGGTQEMLDPYYLSITLSAQKMFADYGPQPADRLMGRILVDRTMELLVSVYHSQTRRLIAASNRARMSGIFVEQDGIYGALHTLSKDGAVNYLDQQAPGKVQGMPAWGYDFPPGRVAIQAQAAPWGPSWLSDLIDDKPVGFEETSTETTRGNFRPPLWRRTWLGKWCGLGSADIRGGTVDVLAHWVRKPEKAKRLEDLGSLTVRYCANKPDLVTTGGGITAQAGLTLTYQSRNRAIVFAKPHGNRQRFLDAAGNEVSQLATVIGLWNFNTAPNWEVRIDDRKVETLPQRATSQQKILIRDGVTYLAIRPLPASDLGRDAEIEISRGGGGKADPTGAEVAPALIVSLFNMRSGRATPVGNLDMRTIGSRTYGGFVLEIGDAEQHGSFDAFAKHIEATELKATWNEDDKRMDVVYRSGGDTMEAGFGTDFGQPAEQHYVINPGTQEKAIPYRRLNGQWPYLPPGLERDTGWSQQGTTGRLEKNGAVLTGDAGRKSYLLADPRSGAVVGYNPLPDPQLFRLTTRDGASFTADGKVGLLRLEYRPWAREVEISYAPKPDQNGSDMARNIAIEGMAEAPTVTLNGRKVEVARGDKGFQVALS